MCAAASVLIRRDKGEIRKGWREGGMREREIREG